MWGRGTPGWLSQLGVGLLMWAQVVISGSWNQGLTLVPQSPGSLLGILYLSHGPSLHSPLCSLSFSQISKTLKEREREKENLGEAKSLRRKGSRCWKPSLWMDKQDTLNTENLIRDFTGSVKVVFSDRSIHILRYSIP